MAIIYYLVNILSSEADACEGESEGVPDTNVGGGEGVEASTRQQRGSEEGASVATALHSSSASDRGTPK